MIGDKGESGALFVGTSGPTAAMHENLLIGGVVIVDDNANFRNVEATSSHICNYQDAFFLSSELLHGGSALLHVHLAVNTLALVVLFNKRYQIVNVEASGHEHYYLLFTNDMLQ